MLRLRLERAFSDVVACARHGTSAWCYRQLDGRHIDADRCRCLLRPSADCPIDVHRQAARAALLTGQREPASAEERAGNGASEGSRYS